ncbi:hypothetical protein BH10BDE1_BH10BDE1_13870 [soil metagenome]
MLLRIVQRLMITLTFLAGTPTLALDCNTPNLASYFGNGMFNSDRQADNNRAELETFMRARNLLSRGETVALAYNFSEAAAEQLLQVSTQKDEETGRSFFRWVSNLSSAPEFFRKIAQTAMTAYDLKAYLEDQDLRIQIERYEKDLKSGKVIVVVGHSQGNLYSNRAWELLRRLGRYNGKFALVGAATPTGYIAGDGPYSTLTQDKVMEFVRSQKGALPANVTNARASASGHEFVSEYLEGSVSGPKIRDDLKDVISKVVSNVSVPSQAALEYLDSSLSPFLHHACKLQATKSKFTDGECIALAALDRTYGWFGEDRKERSLKALNEWIDQCDTKEFWHSSSRFDFLNCSMLSLVPSLDPSGTTKAELAFFANDHPECNWQNQEVGRRTTPQAVSTARALLNSTPKLFRLGGE